MFLNKNKRLLFYIVLFLSIIILLLPIFSFVKYIGILSWDNVDGVVIQSSLKKNIIEEGSEMKFEDLTYELVVEYEYSVGNIKYQNDQYSQRVIRYGSPQTAAEALEDYGIGEKITVYYKSSDPGKSLLSKEFDWRTNIILFFLGLFLTPIFYLVVYRQKYIYIQRIAFICGIVSVGLSLVMAFNTDNNLMILLFVIISIISLILSFTILFINKSRFVKLMKKKKKIKDMTTEEIMKKYFYK